MTDLTPFERITDNINQLVTPYTHREQFNTASVRLRRHLGLLTKDHTGFVTEHPSPLDQLRDAVYPAVSELDYIGGAFGSRPPTNTDALNALQRIESGAAWWLKIRYERDLRGTCENNLRALIGASTEPHRTSTQLAELAIDTARWLTIAQTESGWTPRPFTVDKTPDGMTAYTCPALVCDLSRKHLWAGYCNDHDDDPMPYSAPCPQSTCGRTRSLRIRRPDADHAWCTHCGAAWSEYNPNLPSVLLLVDALTAQRGAA